MNPARVVDRGIRFTKISSAGLVDFVLRFNKRSREQKGAGHANIVADALGLVQGVLEHRVSPSKIVKLDVLPPLPPNYRRVVVRVDSRV